MTAGRLKIWNELAGAWEYPPGGVSGSQTVLASDPLTLSASDLHTIADTPVQILPSPGPGKAILCLAAATQYIPGVTGFATVGSAGFVFVPAGGALSAAKQGYDALLFVGSHDMTGTDPILDYDSFVWRGGPPVLSGMVDKAVNVTSDANITDGDGSVVVTLYYSVITVA